MPRLNGREIEERITGILRRYSGRGSIGADQFIGRDIGVFGGDSIQFLAEIEEEFDVDLRPLVNDNTDYLKPNWYDRLQGKKLGNPVADLTLRQLVDYIEKSRS